MSLRAKRADRRRERSAAESSRPPGRTFLPASSLLPLLIVVAGLVAYTNGFQGAFVFDDVQAIVENPTIRQLSWKALSPPAPTAVTARPIVNLSLALNYAVSELDVSSYHAFNLAIHLLAALTLFGIVRRTLQLPDLRDRTEGAAAGIAAAVAVIWVVHPLLTESVSYVIQRTELLMGLFYLLTLYAVIRGAESRRPRPWYAAAVLAFVLGMGCKEVMVTAPLVVLVYDRMFLSTSFADLLRRRWTLYASLAAILLFGLAQPRFRHVLTFGLRGILLRRIGPWEYAKTQCGVIVHYLGLAIWPHALAADYDDWPVAKSLIDVLPSALVVVMLLGATLWGLWRRAPLAFLGVWFFFILAPTSSFWSLLTEVAAERRMYLSLAAVITLLVLGGYALLRRLFPHPTQAFRRQLVASVLVTAVAVTFSALTAQRNADYRTPLAFWTAAVTTRPNAVRARINLGDVLFKSGRGDEAAVQYAEAVRLGPDYLLAQYGLAVTFARQGKTDEAIAHYREALRINPTFAAAHNNLAVLLEDQGKTGEAVEHYRAAVRFQAGLVAAHFNLALLLQRQGSAEEALGHLETVRKLEPDLDEARAAIESVRRELAQRTPRLE